MQPTIISEHVVSHWRPYRRKNELRELPQKPVKTVEPNG